MMTYMAEDKRQLLTIGVFFIAVVVALLSTTLIGWGYVVPIVLLVFGAWMLALAVARNTQPQKYERSSFSTMTIGLSILVVGGAWLMLAIGLNWLYAFALILLLVAGLAIGAALKRK
jgi:hypothetical protein